MFVVVRVVRKGLNLDCSVCVCEQFSFPFFSFPIGVLSLMLLLLMSLHEFGCMARS